MPAELKEGDRVQIADREATAEEQKNATFFNHFRSVIGSVQKLYSTGDAAIEVELDSLSEEIEKRHLDVQEQMKTKWLDGLSEEARSRLSDRERDFKLHYTLLVPIKDIQLAPDAVAPPRKPSLPTPAEPIVKAVAADETVSDGDDEQTEEVLEEIEEAPEPPHRRTMEEIEAAEAEELERRARAEE